MRAAGWCASGYAAQAVFFAAYYWSLGLFFSWWHVVGMGALLAPLLGWFWIGWMGSIVWLAGRFLGGEGKREEVFQAVGYSKAPLLLFLPLWTFFIWREPRYVFILGVAEPSPILIQGVSFCLGTWSQFLCFQAIRKIQGFTRARALANIALSWFIYCISFFVLFSVIRFLYIIYIVK